MIPTDEELRNKAAALVVAYTERGWTIATAESCTGGLISAFITEIAGSSAVLDRGFVTYSNAAKSEMIGVPSSLVAAHGAVSREVAHAMAQGARAFAKTDVAVAVTGVAGPGGGSAEKPVGLVHFGLASASRTRTEMRRFGALPRAHIRRLSVDLALDLLNQTLGAEAP